MKNIKKASMLFALFVCFTTLLILATLLYQYGNKALISSSDHTSELLTVKLPAGTGAAHLVDTLTQQQLIGMPAAWKIVITLLTLKQKLKAGEYQITPGMTLKSLLQTILNGQVYRREFTVVEGWRYQRLLKRINANQTLKHITKHLTESQLAKLLKLQPCAPEGQFYPDTYFYTWGNRDIDLLKQAYTKMQQVLTEEWIKRSHPLPYKTPYEGLIAASLIEKETALTEEKTMIASVIVNRLAKKMPLQIDPTVKYGLGFGNSYRLSRADLLKLTPFNTYRKKGLPPTPIALPGRSSIWAALHPSKTDYLYFVVSQKGKHQFSKTYREHLKAVKRYLHRPSAHDKDYSLKKNGKARSSEKTV